MTTQELDDLQRLCEAATPVPWGTGGGGGGQHDKVIDENGRGVAYDIFLDGNLDFIVASRTALPALIGEVRRLTTENAFLRKAYRDKAVLNRLMRESQEIAENAAEGPYKDYYDRVRVLPDCNDCGRKDCEYKPRCGEQVRINCPLWIGPQPDKANDNRPT